MSDEHALEFLLAFDGRVHYFEQGYWLKFEIKRVRPTPARPHGLRYAFTLHSPTGERLMGFDNAHTVPAPGARYRKPAAQHDHWHRTLNDPGRPYRFTTVDHLLHDFQAEVERVLAALGIPADVIGEGTAAQRTPT